MTLPSEIKSGFLFDEAIDLAECAARARQVFAYNSGDEAQTLYNLLFKGDEWRCVQVLGRKQTKVLLLQRHHLPQFALVFQVVRAASRGAPATQTAPAADQMIAVTNVAPTKRPRPQRWPAVDDSVAYVALSGQRNPLLREARIYRQWQQAWEEIRAELEPICGPAGLLALQGEFSLYVTGHHVGGCVAALAALHLQQSWEAQLDFPSFHLKLYTLGSPKLGNRAFADYYKQQMNGFSYCVQNRLDAATYEPLPQPHLLYGLAARLPGVANLRRGNRYFMTYEPVGEVWALPGIGCAPQALDVRSGFKALLPSPFAHDAAGYQAMLREAQSVQATIIVPAQQTVNWLNKQKEQLLATIAKQMAAWQSAAAKSMNRAGD